MKNIKNIIQLIDDAIKEDAELNIMWWWIIKNWYNKDVDFFSDIISNSNNWLAEYQLNLSTKYWINSLKIKHTNASGYFIEIPKSQITKVPDDFINKQSLVNASRFITEELIEFQEKILWAEWKKSEKEYEIFSEVRDLILNSFDEIKIIWEKIGYIDFLTWLSQVAYDFNYIKPKINDNYNLDIVWWRHAVIEQNNNDFISNNLNLTNKKFIHIITWPNMWWKSTFLRQNALIVLLTHIWSFIPAKSANIPLTDKIFSRIGASDNLFLGESTFMVEMQEVANILNNSTDKSFIIIDEVWRWTSTYDWMSLAWAILKENHDNIKSKTLFATHYHELIDESKTLKGVDNFSVAVWENEENLVFLRKIIPGWIKKSFWLEVAKIAWLSNSTITEARLMLKKLELSHNKISWIQMIISDDDSLKNIEKVSKCDSELTQKIKNINVNNLTPLDALNLINELKNINEKK